jgi:hypothetical protein
MLRTVLLGAAAGLVTMGAAKAADLPMTKAEAVEYVKVCTEFGEGFFYIPGTDTCLRVSGEVRADYRFDSRDGRLDDVVNFRSQGRVKFDARTATEYGTLRSFFQINATADNGSSDFSVDKAFIQFGGLTAGYAHTFFGIYDADYGNTIFAPYFASSSTVNLLAYTAVFGGGFSATLSIEDGIEHRSKGLVEFVPATGPTGLPTFTTVNAGYGGQSVPDVVGQLRYDGAWGEAAVFGAAHQIRYPIEIDADYGFAIGAGVGVNLPFAAGAHIALEATYADGALNYLGANNREFAYQSVAGFDTDGRRGWSVTGEFGVNVTPALSLVAFGSYGHLDGFKLDDFDAPNATGSGIEKGDLSAWVAGVNATYTVVKGLTVAAEVYYQDNVDIADDIDGDNEWAGGVRIKRTF